MKIRKIAIALIVLCTAALAVRIVRTNAYNHALMSGFHADGKTSEPYNMHIPMEKERFAESYYFVFNKYISLGEPPMYKMKLDKSICYYKEPNSKTDPVIKTEPNVEYVIFNAALDYPSKVGYGIRSWPTYKKGWRYAIPIATPDEMKRINDFHEVEMYYVRGNDLRYICDCAIQQNLIPTKSPIGDLSDNLINTEYILLRNDRELYDNGAYLSPDLFKRIIDPYNFFLLILDDIFSTYLIFALFYTSRKRTPFK